jgi:hypothetical protein
VTGTRIVQQWHVPAARGAPLSPPAARPARARRRPLRPPWLAPPSPASGPAPAAGEDFRVLWLCCLSCLSCLSCIFCLSSLSLSFCVSLPGTHRLLLGRLHVHPHRRELLPAGLAHPAAAGPAAAADTCRGAWARVTTGRLSHSVDQIMTLVNLGHFSTPDMGLPLVDAPWPPPPMPIPAMPFKSCAAETVRLLARLLCTHEGRHDIMFPHPVLVYVHNPYRERKWQCRMALSGAVWPPRTCTAPASRAAMRSFARSFATRPAGTPPAEREQSWPRVAGQLIIFNS